MRLRFAMAKSINTLLRLKLFPNIISNLKQELIKFTKPNLSQKYISRESSKGEISVKIFD